MAGNISTECVDSHTNNGNSTALQRYMTNISADPNNVDFNDTSIIFPYNSYDFDINGMDILDGNLKHKNADFNLCDTTISDNGDDFNPCDTTISDNGDVYLCSTICEKNVHDISYSVSSTNLTPTTLDTNISHNVSVDNISTVTSGSTPASRGLVPRSNSMNVSCINDENGNDMNSEQCKSDTDDVEVCDDTFIDPLVKCLSQSRQKHGKNLIFTHVNINSLGSKKEYIIEILIKGYVDVLCITEAKLSDKYVDNEFKVEGYKFYRLDRASNSGGLVIWIRADLPHIFLIF